MNTNNLVGSRERYVRRIRQGYLHGDRSVCFMYLSFFAVYFVEKREVYLFSKRPIAQRMSDNFLVGFRDFLIRIQPNISAHSANDKIHGILIKHLLG